MIALFVLILILGTSASFWLSMERSFQNQLNLSELRTKATLTFDTITGDTNSARGGIINEKRQVDTEKLADFLAADYETQKEMLLIGNYDFYFRIFDSSTTYATKGSIKETDAVSIQRPMIYMGKIVKGELILYEKTQN